MSGEQEKKEHSAALATVDSTALSAESLALINQIIAEADVQKTKDLTYLFNINQNKKTMVRMNKLNDLQDDLVEQFAKRISERPDEISNQELMQGLKVVQDMLERGQQQIQEVNEKPLIQINQQTNTVNVGDGAITELNRESREKVKNAVMTLLRGVRAAGSTDADVIDMKPAKPEGDDDN